MQALPLSSKSFQDLWYSFLVQEAAREDDFSGRKVCSGRWQCLEPPFLVGDAVENNVAIVGELLLVLVGRVLPGCPRLVCFVDDAIVVGQLSASVDLSCDAIAVEKRTPR